MKRLRESQYKATCACDLTHLWNLLRNYPTRQTFDNGGLPDTWGTQQHWVRLCAARENWELSVLAKVKPQKYTDSEWSCESLDMRQTLVPSTDSVTHTFISPDYRV